MNERRKQKLQSSMPITSTSQKEHIQYHKDGSVWAKGQTANGVPIGYWEWFRLDGTKMRSGHFEKGEQAGEWTTYDKKGKKYKVTNIKPKTKKKPNVA
jgi:antitoxin component YwqK of YwqJK toxin-antitoxin module